MAAKTNPLDSSLDNEDIFSVLDERYSSTFGKDFLEAVKYALNVCKYKFVPKFEQLQALFHLSQGKDVFVNLGTGFGKSLIYILFPFVSSPTQAYVFSVVVLISPLISLMDDQMSKMKERCVNVLKLTNLTERQVQQLRPKSCQYKILIISPEGFNGKAEREVIKNLKEEIVCVAVDEAHCIEQW